MSEKKLSIQFVSKVTGINPHTIRAWEKRYDAVVPLRDENGRRQYREIDIDRLNLLNKLVKSGNNISEIAKLDNAQLEELCESFSIGRTPVTAPKSEEPFDHITVLQNLVMALRTYRLDIIAHELGKVSATISARDFALKILLPLVQEVGSQVDANFLSIAQEHALSAILRFHTGRVLSEYISKQDRVGKKVIICTPEGERHEFGILVTSMLCIHYNYDFYYLGVDLPSESLIDAVDQLKPDIVILGISKQMNFNHLPKLRQYISEVHGVIDENIKLWIGGTAPYDTGGKQVNLTFIPSLQFLDNLLESH